MVSGGVLPVNGHLSSLGQEVFVNDSGEITGSSQHSGTTSGFSTGNAASTSTPVPTLVAKNGSNFEIDLVWDQSISNAPSGFEAAVIAAAQAYVQDMTSLSKVIIYINVGWGEINGTHLAANALGESESYGYLTNYSTIVGALEGNGDTSQMFSATNEPINAQFFVTSAQAKALGLVPGTSGSISSVDGYIGFSTLSGTGDTWNFGTSGTGNNQFNMESVVAHEVSEVMGRISMEGSVTYNGKVTYTPLDLFIFSGKGHLELSGNGGYFSNNDGISQSGNYNNAMVNGGDIADWASNFSVTQSNTVTAGQEDAYDAFDAPGYNGVVSPDDLIEMSDLGYGVRSTNPIPV